MPIVDTELLKKTALFSLLDDNEIGVLAEHLDEKDYLAGQLIFAAGEAGDAMYIVEEGKVELFLQDKVDDRVVLGLVEPGDLFGELSLLDNSPRSASAKALENTHLLIIDREDLLLLVKSHPHSALDMMRMLGKRIREANLLVQSRVTRNANEEMPVATNFGTKLSDILTTIAGDIRFVYFSAIWFFVWVVLNTNIIPGVTPFDPFPFGLLTMVVSLEAIFLSLFVLISQNRQEAREKVRNDIEYDVNLRAEIEVRELMKQVETMQEIMVKHLSAMQAFESKNKTHPELPAISSKKEEASSG